MGKGVFGEVERHQMPNNKKEFQDIILYYKADGSGGGTTTTTGTGIAVQRVQSTLCMPIFKDDVFCGILEVSNSRNNNFAFDEEFYAVILARFVSTVVKRLVDFRNVRAELKYYDYFYEAFVDFVAAPT
jgi:transcriptional regulator with GAF, ATPase, and Fis domain